jgi:hypothetical protein
MGVEQLDQFSEVRKWPGQPINYVDDNDVDPGSANVLEESPERRPVHRPTRIASVVVVIARQSPALMRLTFDVSLRPSRWASRELKSCSSPWSVETRV